MCGVHPRRPLVIFFKKGEGMKATAKNQIKSNQIKLNSKGGMFQREASVLDSHEKKF
jgi:hypothetical protein